MLQFVPLTDDMLFRAETLLPPLVPYQCGLSCRHGLREAQAALACPAAPAEHEPNRALNA